VVNGLMYILATGCQWRAIPKDLPPKSTIYLAAAALARRNERFYQLPFGVGQCSREVWLQRLVCRWPSYRPNAKARYVLW
jgi:transposase